ncbi:hypothetical protein [uncultured Selenomonas sp.]|uniref:hypothetical protein n=1 Tax=uncultured Selenomonas sp. TaxID=159275 RepID=UPI0025879383|nr:hypothetical protein [uncultured Selenomonas sp.]
MYLSIEAMTEAFERRPSPLLSKGFAKRQIVRDLSLSRFMPGIPFAMEEELRYNEKRL